MLKKIGLAALLLSTAGIASAVPTSRSCGWDDVTIHIGRLSFKIPEWECTAGPGPLQAPEFDATPAVAGLLLMGGAFAVMRGRRTKNSKT